MTMVRNRVELRAKCYDSTKKDKISFALREQGRLHKYMKYIPQALNMNTNVPDKEGKEGR